MKSLSKLNTLFFLALTTLTAPATQAAGPSGYSHDVLNGAWNPGWMSALPDNRRYSELSLVATHDSMSFYGGDIPQTQSMSIFNQLLAGVRGLDIRCRHMNNEFKIYHGFVDQHADFRDVLTAVQAFLRMNPRETVYMEVGSETTSITPETHNTRSFTETYDAYKAEFANLFWEYTGNNPSLGETRGKVVLIQNFDKSSTPRRGISVDSFISAGPLPGQTDSWTIANNWQLYDKWMAVKNNLVKATQHPERGAWTSLSASNGSFPYFVVSGKSSPGTDAPQLMTGLVTGITADENTYPDFPRVSCLGKLCSIAFMGTNQLTNQYLIGLKLRVDIQNSLRSPANRLPYPRIGVISTDFPGAGLINSTIALNNR